MTCLCTHPRADHQLRDLNEPPTDGCDLCDCPGYAEELHTYWPTTYLPPLAPQHYTAAELARRGDPLEWLEGR